MDTPEAVIDVIRRAFATTERPPDAYLTNGGDGCEPEESVAPFRGLEWSGLESAMLDANYTALSFFSEGAFRYFVPAFMVADVRDELRTADPVFHLTHGLAPSFESTIEAGGRSWRRRTGGETLLNPRRYGATTWRDYARFRLSAFSREEAAAIVVYLRWRRTRDEFPQDIDAALEGFWLERAERAPTSAELAAHVAEELAYMAAAPWRQIRPQQPE